VVKYVNNVEAKSVLPIQENLRYLECKSRKYWVRNMNNIHDEVINILQMKKKEKTKYQHCYITVAEWSLFS